MNFLGVFVYRAPPYPVCAVLLENFDSLIFITLEQKIAPPCPVGAVLSENFDFSIFITLVQEIAPPSMVAVL